MHPRHVTFSPIASEVESHANIVELVLKHGANASLMDSERRSSLMLAESDGHRKTAARLVAK